MVEGLDRTLLATPPLIVTLAQARFEDRAELAEVSAASLLRAPMAAHGLTSATQVHMQQVVVGAPEAEAESELSSKASVGWQFKAPGDAVVVTILRDQMSLEVKRYPGWDAFVEVWASCVEGLLNVVRPELVTRLGLRYVNRIRPRATADVTGWADSNLVAPSFLGPAVGSALSSFVTGAEGRTALTFEDGTEALVHHGIATEADGPTFMLDIDCFNTRAEIFSSDAVITGLQTLNNHSLQVFQEVVKEGLRSEMTGAKGEVL